MSHDWKPEEWHEMDGRDVLSCLADDYEAEYEIDGVPWLHLIPNAVLAEALCNVDIYHQYAVCAEAARRLAELEELRGIITRVSAQTYGSEAYPISREDEDRMDALVKEWNR